ncbi:hypothetical protein E2562_005625 [Oryza meyeriana var. granulata]|uniref:DUF834 domain-containing protein n=1 Tax=Oryza meyeriana var. granulata TaxID=110450 RepID=A0A6G1BJ03_9ORYZ|nr:hypothetical protein E2562_005625 [Oryza meyeriana var. granulata]
MVLCDEVERNDGGDQLRPKMVEHRRHRAAWQRDGDDSDRRWRTSRLKRRIGAPSLAVDDDVDEQGEKVGRQWGDAHQSLAATAKTMMAMPGGEVPSNSSGREQGQECREAAAELGLLDERGGGTHI